MERQSWNVSVPCGTAGFDFADLTPRSAAGKAAVEICLECPVMVRCLDYLRTTEVAGVAGGMGEKERQAWRRAQGLEPSPRPLEIWETTPVDDLEPAMLLEMPVRVRQERTRAFAPAVVALTFRLTEAGWTAKQIAALIPDESFRKQSVDYIRREKGGNSKMTERRKAAWLAAHPGRRGWRPRSSATHAA